MLNVLINAYAVSPNWGSEPGMGWNWIVNIAKHCNVFVVTEGEWKEEIFEAVAKLPQRENIHFFFNPLPDRVRKMCWNQGDWRFYWYYAKWQKRTLEIAREIIAKHKIDVMHQLNMIGFREPGYLWKIKDIPLVWGPVGGVANIPTAYLKDAGWKMNLFCRIKNFISDLQFRFHPRVRAAVKRSTMIAAMKEVQEATRRVYGKEIPVINETGTYPTQPEMNIEIKSGQNSFNVLWVGKFDFRKQFDLALRSVARMRGRDNVCFHVVAPMTDMQQRHIKSLVEAEGMDGNVVLHGRIPNMEVHELMKRSDVFLFTSLSEGTPHVILEAVRNSLPIVCFDICGHGEVVDESIGIKLPPSTPERSADGFTKALDRLKDNPQLRMRLAANCRQKQKQCAWDAKVRKLVGIYSESINNNTFNH